MMCKDCKYWTGKVFSDGHHECEKLSEELVGGKLQCTTGDESCPFVTTAPDFKCIYFDKIAA